MNELEKKKKKQKQKKKKKKFGAYAYRSSDTIKEFLKEIELAEYFDQPSH
jgi:hypothetical protein